VTDGQKCIQGAQNKNSATTDKDIVVTVSQDETWKIETQPSQDVQVSRLKAKTHRQELQQVD